ncbi:MAG TPA: mannose-1-phosphate guanyltransferase [Herpetosiphonaceae bacterium]|nr:mannose-1-phosphate guanyltransferase [Herpetosiphonaceae bacterium]
MKAVVMAGGEGSRLRPLTINRPKPMVPLADRSVMWHIIELLKLHGITDLVVTIQYLANVIQDQFGDGSAYGVHIDYSVEETPLGTAGSVKHAEHLLQEPFLVISGDALTDIDLSALISFHAAKGGVATLTLKHVPNPLDYGVIITDANGQITQFLEKPSWGELFSDMVNTGIYMLEPAVFDFIEKGAMVDWAKDVFPAMLAQDKALFGYVADGYWTDVGTIQEYMRATADYLSGKVNIPRIGQRIDGDVWVGGEVEIAPDAHLNGPIFLGHGVKIKSGVRIHGPSVVRDYTVVDARALIDQSIIWRNSYIGERVELRGAIVGRQCNIKSRAVVFEGVVIGDQTVVNSSAVIQPEVKIWPSKQIDEGATVSTSLIWGSHGRRRLFGRNGITGLVNVDITPEFCAKLGAAYGGTFKRGATILINRDDHYTPRMLKRALQTGLPSAGVNVDDVRSVPIPVARYLVHALGADGGVHVRLSPMDSRVVDIKFFDKDGIDIDTSAERKIESYFFREDYRRAYLDEIGRITYPSNVEEKYVRGFFGALRQEALESIAGRFNIVVDYAGANSSSILFPILRQIRCDTVELNAIFDEAKLFQTAQQFEEAMDQLAAIVPVLHAELGVRFDTSGERVNLVDNRGRRLTRWQALAAVADLTFRSYGPGTIAVPVTAPRAFETIAERYGGTVVRTRANMSAMMQLATHHRDYLLLGDAEGNFIFPSFYPVADGIFATVKLMELLALQQVKLADVVAGLPRYHMARTRVACRWENKGKVMRILNERYAQGQPDQIDGVKIDLGNAWVLVLPDPDGPFFHVHTEGASDEHARELTDRYAGLVMSLQ